MHGMASFSQTLNAIDDAWHNRHQEVLDQAQKVTEAVRQHLAGQGEPGHVDARLVQRTANQLLHHYDTEHGGFGGAPKFPQPATLQCLLGVYDNNQDASIFEAIDYTLTQMGRGGIFDQIGGGFHRYSTDERWLVPHFEKMLYDNGQLLETYALLYERSTEAGTRRRHARTLRETAEYVLREMVDDTGAFYSAQDAEVHGREGGSYLWTADEVKQALDDESAADFALSLYGLDRGANFRDPHDPNAQPANVLYLPEALEAVAETHSETLDVIEQRRVAINEQLLAARNARPQPRTDDKILTAWNGLMIAGLAKAGRALNEMRYIDAARRAAEAIDTHMRRSDGSLYRTMRGQTPAIAGQLEDYALFAHGLLELYRATGEQTYFDRARRDMQQAAALFEAEQGGYYDTLADQADLLVRLHSAIDGSMPSGNSQMAHNLLDVYALAGEQAALDRVARDLKRFAQPMHDRGHAMPHMIHALLRALEIAPQAFADGEGEAETGAASQSQPVVAHVRAEPESVDLSQGPATVRVEVTPPAGYHLNAHEPGDSSLIALCVDLAEPAPLNVSVAYPAGTARQYAFADTPLRVHESTASIDVQLQPTSEGGLPDQVMLVVSYQLCSDRACLEPAQHTVTIDTKR